VGNAGATDKMDDPREAVNQISKHDAAARREMLKQITELGLKHMEDKKVTIGLPGHKIGLQDAVSNAAGAIEWIKDFVKDAITGLPHASIVLAAISLVLPLLKNPSAAEDANREGFAYVTLQMRYYCAMESLLLPEHMKDDLKADLEERIVDLYKLIISFFSSLLW
jgi:hypothetical protein